MAWTWPIAIFFGGIVCWLIAFTVFAIKYTQTLSRWITLVICERNYLTKGFALERA